MNPIPDQTAARILAAARPEALAAPESGIVEVFNYGRDRQGLMPLWVGEGDLPTAAFISNAAKRALDAGETFYTTQRGHPDYRAALARMMTRVYGSPFADNVGAFRHDRFYATVGGMHALQLAVRIADGAGDEAIVLTPAWPNFSGALIAAGADSTLATIEGADHCFWGVSGEGIVERDIAFLRAKLGAR